MGKYCKYQTINTEKPYYLKFFFLVFCLHGMVKCQRGARLRVSVCWLYRVHLLVVNFLTCYIKIRSYNLSCELRMVVTCE